ncbi:hypothetical protein IG631_13843 [Alternaria alternata]|nr:hypothetical protein IG631_13843 [Alternaria alternata]
MNRWQERVGTDAWIFPGAGISHRLHHPCSNTSASRSVEQREKRLTALATPICAFAGRSRSKAGVDGGRMGDLACGVLIC